MLLQKAACMFPEGNGAPKAFIKDGSAAEKTNELLENAVAAIFEMWKRRGYNPKTPEETKVKVGYALDRYRHHRPPSRCGVTDENVRTRTGTRPPRTSSRAPCTCRYCHSRRRGSSASAS